MENEQQPYRVNITRKVTGKMEQGNMIFYHNKSPIGHMDLNTMQVEMYDGFAMEEESIYAVGDQPIYQEQYAENCDLGWC
ncbi:DUF2553 family protein [Hazenella coriacea]|uniref:Uncharacterized protein DUF2553 n=1 Tax=Hazenella coriacea TaxID=1179467 RepID=A0A4R3L7K3_9BACL|nr:DUF2553 family protein [Hazenella coriacea]TCS95931.1 uncharacterized protein DUF2553 [Hazenella coriacea]